MASGPTSYEFEVLTTSATTSATAALHEIIISNGNQDAKITLHDLALGKDREVHKFTRLDSSKSKVEIVPSGSNTFYDGSTKLLIAKNQFVSLLSHKNEGSGKWIIFWHSV